MYYISYSTEDDIKEKRKQTLVLAFPVLQKEVIVVGFKDELKGIHAEGQRIDAFELWCKRRLESLLDCKEIKPINPKGNQPWIFIGRTDAEAEVPILWPPDAKSRLIRKKPDAEKDWSHEEKGVTEDEIIGWHRWLNGHEFEQAPGDSEG